MTSLNPQNPTQFARYRAGFEMTLNDYTLRAAVDLGEMFREGPANVTALAYFFRDEASFDAAFWPQWSGVKPLGFHSLAGWGKWWTA